MKLTSAESAKARERERRTVHIINPVSGSGRKFKKTHQTLTSLKETIYLTKRESDCTEFVRELLTKDPYTHIVAHGGDGTMSEAVTGIMEAGAGKTALFTGVPSGSGNDFLRYMYEEKNVCGKLYPTDLIRANGRYSVNVVNVGFDCTVVSEAEKIRKAPGIGSSFSYILGVVSALTKKTAFKTGVALKGIRRASGELYDDELRGEYLLAAVANGRYYGGGFKVAPRSDSSDGFIDVILVKNVSVPKFASLVSGFRKGTHLAANGAVKENFKDVLIFKRCLGVSFGGIKEVCFDGEIESHDRLVAEVVPRAIIYTPPKKEWVL